MSLTRSNTLIGLIAGNGVFPLEFSKNAKREGFRVIAVAHRGETDPALEGLVEACHWIKAGQLGKMIKILVRAGISQAAFVGGLTRAKLFSGLHPDLKGMLVLARLKSFKDDVILRAVAAELHAHGIEVFSSSELLTESVVKAGILTRRRLDEDQLADALIGWECAREIGRLDVGQTVIVNRKSIVAIEAVEGTDKAIERAGALSGAGATVVKVCKPQQDTRFDLPSIGIGTIRTMQSAGAKALVLEAERSLMLHPSEVVQAADSAGIAIIAVTSAAQLGSSKG